MKSGTFFLEEITPFESMLHRAERVLAQRTTKSTTALMAQKTWTRSLQIRMS